MIHRKDMILGISLVAIIFVICLGAFLILVSDMFDDLDVSGKRIAVIEIKGMIISPKGVVEKLERYIKNDDIPAIVIRLNTPVAASGGY